MGYGKIYLGDSLSLAIPTKTVPETIHDWRRTGELAVTAAVFGPLLHYWYLWLDKRYPLKTASHMVKKVGLDFSLVLVYYPLFFGILNAVKVEEKRQDFKTFSSNLLEKMKVMITFDCVLWPPLQFINFWFLSPSLRVIGTKFSELIFDFLISFVEHNDIKFEDLINFAKEKCDKK